MNKIDCHTLTLPQDNPEWKRQLNCLFDKTGCVIPYWVNGIEGRIGEARYNGFHCGESKYKSFIDSDDLFVPSIFQEMLLVLEKSDAPFIVSEEVKIDVNGLVLENSGNGKWRSSVWEPDKHKKNPRYIHGVIIYKKDCLLPVLEGCRHIDNGIETVLAYRVAKKFGSPILYPEVGLYWRQHKNQSHRKFTSKNIEKEWEC